MKAIKTLLVLLIIFNANTNAQITEAKPSLSKDDEELKFTKVEEEAKFPDGNEGWKKFLTRNLKSDKIANKIYIPDSLSYITHTVVLKFMVDIDGSLSNITVEKSSNSYCSEEALRVIQLSPKWIPAYQNGRIVKAYRRQPITFAFAK